jgi:hypothetical protein
MILDFGDCATVEDVKKRWKEYERSLSNIKRVLEIIDNGN